LYFLSNISFPEVMTGYPLPRTRKFYADADY